VARMENGKDVYRVLIGRSEGKRLRKYLGVGRTITLR
jgi:hypothetical protein